MDFAVCYSRDIPLLGKPWKEGNIADAVMFTDFPGLSELPAILHAVARQAAR
jgi:hypothetical protein